MNKDCFSVRFKKLNELAKTPTKGTKGSAGWDLYAAMPDGVLIEPGEVQKIPTGLAIALPSEELVGLIFARSGLSVSFGVAPANAVGVIDSDYRGELVAALRNYSKVGYTVQPGDRIAQLVVMPVASFELEEVKALDDTSRGAGGFGSTGKN